MSAQAQRSESNAKHSDANEEEEVSFAKSIDEITKHGVTHTDIKKLKEAGFLTVQSILHAPNKHITEVKGITDKKAEDVRAACQKEAYNGFITGTQHLELRQQVKRITTGCRDLDKILGGGIESQSITEIYGEFRTGKTQWVHTLVVTGMLPRDSGGGAGKVIVIDTEGTFRSEKIRPIADRYGVDAAMVLENVSFVRCFNTDHQFATLREVAGLIHQQGPYSLLIIDSITALFRVDYVGRGELSMRQQMLGQMLSRVTKLASEFNIAVLLTNQVMSNPDGGMSFVSDPKKPVGGHVLAHACHTRLELKKGRGECRIAKIVDSPSMPEAEATFQLSDRGIIDPET